MKDFTNFDEYVASQEDIDSIVRFLRIFDPENATQERAIAFLSYLQVGVHQKIEEGASDKEMEELYKKFTDQNKD